MQVTALFHIAIRTARPVATRRFYAEVFGMTEAPRPPFEFPGFWMQLAVPSGDAVFHVYTGGAAVGPDGTVPVGSGAIDHVALTAHGFGELRERCRALDVPWRERGVPGLPLWQLFVYDPNGIQFEFNFHSAAEAATGAVLDPDRFPVAGSAWFDPSKYGRFERDVAAS